VGPRTRTTQGQASPFAPAEAPSTVELQTERAVRYLLVSGRQDDGVWGPVGAVWLSADRRRGGFLIHPWAIDLGTEMVRSYRGALTRGFTASTIYDYWAKEPWTGSNVVVDDERHTETLLLVNELLNVL
jgi:hypothetical protein